VVAHVILNLLGWIGLTVMGTLVTLWPTMLRTRIAEGAERVARQALPILGGSVVVAVAGALCGLQALAAAGVAAYLGGVLWAVRPLSRVARTKPPAAYATWSVMAAVIWLMGSLLGLVTVLVISPTWRLVTDRLGLLIIPLATVFAAQILLGALSFLVPVVLGGGPTILPGTQGRMNRGGALRAVLINVGLLVCIMPVPSEVRVLVAILVAGAFATFLPLLVSAALYAVRAKSAGRRSVDRSPMPRHVPAAAAVTRGRNTRQAAPIWRWSSSLRPLDMHWPGSRLTTGVSAASMGVVATGGARDSPDPSTASGLGSACTTPSSSCGFIGGNAMVASRPRRMMPAALRDVIRAAVTMADSAAAWAG
jgi:nitrite reductase (NO-forming)